MIKPIDEIEKNEEDTIWDDIENKLDTVQNEEIEDILIDNSEMGELEQDDIISNINDESESDLDIYFKFGTNNHKLDGKHSLKRDTILNGKVDEVEVEGMETYKQDMDYFSSHDPVEHGSIFEDESRNNEELANRRNLSQDIYTILKEKTNIDFNVNRRKPNKITFNSYYKMLLNDVGKTYTKSEIFVELAYYFTDNIFNMYKLLDKKYAIGIIEELRDKGYLSNLKSINFM